MREYNTFRICRWIQRKSVCKSDSFKALGLIHIQSKFLSLFKNLLSNHPELTNDFLKLSANIDMLCLFRCSLPLFKQDALMLLLSTKSKHLLRQYFQSLSLTATISSVLSTCSRPIIEEKPNLIFLSLSISSMLATTFRIFDGGNNFPNFRRWQQLSEFSMVAITFQI